MRSNVALVLGLVLAAGCSSSADRREGDAAVTAARSSSASGSGQGLYDLPDMRTALAHRERGARKMESAYKLSDISMRDHTFQTATVEFQAAQDAYHAALTSAAARFQPAIEHEITQVQQYMRQIRRDRSAPKLD